MNNLEEKIYNSPVEEKVSNYRRSSLIDILIVLIFLLIIALLTSHVSEYLFFPFYFNVMVLILAVFRLTKLFTSDHITQFIRDIFFDLEIQRIDNEDMVKRKFPKNGIKRKIAKLFDCPWCISVWIALISVFLWLNYPNTIFFFLIMALSGLGTVLFLLVKK